MTKFMLLTFGLFFYSVNTFANTTSYNDANKPFVFIESGIEFAVFKDGQFDFNVIQPNIGVHINTRTINFSFNSGYNYDTYVQYDDYGAVVQIENTPLFYDHFGRVSRIGAIDLLYNHIGLAYRIGNLNISYNRQGIFNHCYGAVNTYNSNYGFRPHHSYYRVPQANHCIVTRSPYRQTYVVNRCNYATYRTNYHAGYYGKPYKYRSYRRPGSRIFYNNYNRSSIRYADRNYDTRRPNNRRDSRSYRPHNSNNTRKVAPKTRSYSPRSNSTNRSYTSNAVRNQNSRNYKPRTTSRSSNTRTNTSRRTVASTGNAYRRR